MTKKLVELCVEGANILELCVEGDKLLDQGTSGVYNKAVKGVKVAKGTSFIFFVRLNAILTTTSGVFDQVLLFRRPSP